MTDQGKNEQLERQAKALFDDSVERLDAASLSRLNQSRHKALAGLGHAEPRGQWLRWAPAAGVAAAAVVTVIVMRGPEVAELEPVAESDFEMLLEEDSFEMFEDLEFYAVLDAVAAEANGDVG